MLSTTYGQADTTRKSAAVQAASQITSGAAPTAQSVPAVFLNENAAQVTLTETSSSHFGGRG